MEYGEMAPAGPREEARIPRYPGSWVWVGVLFEGGVGVVAVLVGWMLGVRPERTLKWTVAGLGWGIVATSPLLCLLVTTMRVRTGRLARFRRFVVHEIGPFFQGISKVKLAILSAAAGLGEELLFRGLIQGGLELVVPRWAALLAGSLIFGLAHPISPLYVLLVTVVGVYLGLVWTWSGNLLVVAVAHGLYDFVALVWLRAAYARTRGQ